MKKPSETAKQGDATTKKKISLTDLIDDRHFMENLHDPKIREEFLKLLSESIGDMPIRNLLEQKLICNQKQNPTLDSGLDSIIDKRLSLLNKSVKSSSPGFYDISKVFISNWHEDLTVEICNQIVINSSLNKLARILKEIPENHAKYGMLIDCLNTKIYDYFKRWLDRKTNSETLTDAIFDATQKKIKYYLSKYKSELDFQPYIQRILFHMFADFLKVNTQLIANEPDPTYYYVRQSFITFNLILFTRLDSKPHHKLIFWHEFMYYIKNTGTKNKPKKAIDHDIFLHENSLLSLSKIWKRAYERIKSNCLELTESKDFSDETITQNEAIRLIMKFDAFTKLLEELVSAIYTEDEYNYLRIQYNEEKVKNIILIDFFKDPPEGELQDNKTTRKNISNWNYRIKKNLTKDLINKNKDL